VNFAIQVRDLNITVERLEDALDRIQRGEWEPRQAANWLLSQTPVHTFQTPRSTLTVTQLMQSLGPPPIPIQDDWDRQTAQLASAFYRTQGFAIGELNADDLCVDDNNRLSLAESFWIKIQDRAASAPSATQAAPTIHAARLSGLDSAKPNRRRPRSIRISKTAAAAAAVIVGSAIVGGWFLTLTSDPPASPNAKAIPKFAADAKSAAKTRSSDIFSATSTPVESSGIPVESSGISVETATVVTPSPIVRSEMPEPATPDRAMLGLDSFAGGKWENGESLLPASDFDPAAPVVDDAPDDVAPDTTAEPDDLVADSPSAKKLDALAVELPPLPKRSDVDNQSMMTLRPGAVETLALRFAMPVSLRLDKSPEGWAVIDTKDNAALAEFASSDDGLNFRWNSIAASRPIANQLMNGCLIQTANAGKTPVETFLRPAIIAPAWPLDVSHSDVQAAWSLGGVVAIKATRLDIGIEVPSTVIHTWVVQHDPSDVRRIQTISEFRLAKDDSVAIRSRLDIRIGPRLKLRVRHAARLTDQMPWQAISGDAVQRAIDQLTDQLAVATAQQSEWKTAYSRADAKTKRVIAPRRDAIDQSIAQGQVISRRLASFDALLAYLQNEATLSMHLTVDWTNLGEPKRQTIFALVTEPETELEPANAR